LGLEQLIQSKGFGRLMPPQGLLVCLVPQRGFDLDTPVSDP
jgi:hypothetical protein